MEVHPPDHPVMTWRQFFIHMATIVLGLLIAIALEQSVEKLHQRHEVKEARRAIGHELQENILLAEMESREARIEHNAFLGNLHSLQYLRDHPGAQLTDLPAPILWFSYDYGQQTTAWKTLRNSQVAEHMPAEEMSDLEGRYYYSDEINAQSLAIWNAAGEASAYDKAGKAPTDLSPEELDAAIRKTEQLLVEEYKFAIYVENLCDGEATLGFRDCIPKSEVDSWLAVPSSQTNVVKTYGDVAQRYYKGREPAAQQIDALSKQLDDLNARK